MKRFLALILAFLILLGMVACGNTKEAPAATTTEAPEPFVTTTLMENGVAACSIVTDGTIEATTFANELKMAISSNFGVSVEIVSNTTEGNGGAEILVGNARPVAEKNREQAARRYGFCSKGRGKCLGAVRHG